MGSELSQILRLTLHSAQDDGGMGTPLRTAGLGRFAQDDGVRSHREYDDVRPRCAGNWRKVLSIPILVTDPRFRFTVGGCWDRWNH